MFRTIFMKDSNFKALIHKDYTNTIFIVKCMDEDNHHNDVAPFTTIQYILCPL